MDALTQAGEGSNLPLGPPQIGSHPPQIGHQSVLAELSTFQSRLGVSELPFDLVQFFPGLVQRRHGSSMRCSGGPLIQPQQRSQRLPSRRTGPSAKEEREDTNSELTQRDLAVDVRHLCPIVPPNLRAPA